MRSYTFFLAAAAAAVVAAPAAAQAEDNASATVSTADLNLSSEDGVKQLERRIRNAAAKVCGPIMGPDIARLRSVQSCRYQAVSNALGEVRTLIAAAKQPGVQMASRVNVRRK